MSTQQSLPKIVRFLEPVEGDTCPHCEARGRWINRFVVEDGRTLAAMSGCVKLFPVSPVAIEEARLRKKERDYKKQGWKGLNKNDTAALEVIEAFYRGEVTERDALDACKSAKARNLQAFTARRMAAR